MNILDELFPPGVANHIFRFLVHPTAEIIKPLFCRTCHRRINKCSKCDKPTCFGCDLCGSISEAMYCETCFDHYKQKISEQQLIIVIHNISVMININH